MGMSLMRSALRARRGARDEIARAALDPGKEDAEHHAHAQPRVALDIVESDERAGHPAGLNDLGDRAVDRALYVGVADVADVAHRRGQVARRHEEDVDVVDLEDLVETRD